MACCGSGKIAGSALRRGHPEEVGRLPGSAGSGAVHYHGTRPVTVVGPVTGRRYRFAAGGAAVVDARDRQALAGQPGFQLR